MPLEQADDEVPEQVAEGLSDKQQQKGPAAGRLVESEGKDRQVSDDGEPAEQGQPDAVSVDFILLCLEFLAGDLEPFLDPLPFPEPAQIEGEQAAQPAAARRGQEAAQVLARCRQDGDIEYVRAERHDGRRQRASQKQAQQAQAFQPFHTAKIT